MHLILTRRLAKRLKTVFRQTLNLTTRGNLPTIQLAANADGIRVRCENGQAAAEYHLAGEQPEETIYIPFDLLADIEGGRDLPVEIASRGTKVTATWREGSVPQLVQVDAPTVHSEVGPPMPERFAENGPELLAALRDASVTTDSEASRFALGCIQIHGDRGELVATDGRQALVQAGFSVPWDGDLLVSASKIFGSKQLPNDQPVHVGQAEDWFVLRVGPWTLWHSINRDGRFPDVTSHIGKVESAVASCDIPASDQKFLLNNLLRLPGKDDYNSPVTIDLNGCVAVRGKQAGQPSCTELVLAASTRKGDPIRLTTDRRYLMRAAQLGFDQLHVFDQATPVLACDKRRKFIWMLLDSKSALAPDKNAVRIESGTGRDNSQTKQPQRQRRTPVTTKTPDRPTRTTAPPATAEQPQLDPIGTAEALQALLRESLQNTTALVRTLKQHRKRNRAVESTLLSLKQLQAIDA